jgi:hypothetical protein
MEVVDIGPTGEIAKFAGYGRTDVAGESVPADGQPGYAPGCIFRKVNTTGGLNLYRNVGSKTSCSFDRIGRASDIVTCTSAALSLTEALHDQKTIVLDRAAGIAVSLPAASIGLRFRLIVKTTFTDVAYISANSGDTIIGHALMGNDTNNNVVDWQATASGNIVTIDMYGTSNSTGGMAGQSVTLECIAANLWFAEVRGDAAGTEGTPFS